MAESTYVCGICHREFNHGWTEEERIAEAKENFGEDVMSQAYVVVCDYCYNDFMKQLTN